MRSFALLACLESRCHQMERLQYVRSVSMLKGVFSVDLMTIRATRREPFSGLEEAGRFWFSSKRRGSEKL